MNYNEAAHISLEEKAMNRKTVAITGSGRGFGFAMLKLFYQNNFNVVIIDVSEASLGEAKTKLEAKKQASQILTFVADVTDRSTIQHVIDETEKTCGGIDIWINNAGVNQAMCPIWELDEKTISRLIDIDLKGTILCTNVIMPLFIKQNRGQLYNIEGFGSDDATITGLSVYGTAKRGITYFTEALAHEVKESGKNIQIGKITPGIMITGFINHNLGDTKFELDEKTKKIYNILGDYPETIAAFMVSRIIKNRKNGVKLMWLTKRRAMGRFLKAPFSKRDFFKEAK